MLINYRLSNFFTGLRYVQSYTHFRIWERGQIKVQSAVKIIIIKAASSDERARAPPHRPEVTNRDASARRGGRTDTAVT